MKILFVGVFDSSYRSTNNSQLRCLMSLGHQVVGYNYRSRAQQLGVEGRDAHLLEAVRSRKFDLVIFSKGNTISLECTKKISENSRTCLWWMDPLTTLNSHPEIIKKASVMDYVCTGIQNTMPMFKEANDNSFYVPEGYDPYVDTPHDLKKDLDVVFVGSLHSNRQQILQDLNMPVKHITNAYGKAHAEVVSRAKICLNFSTAEGASDRVYKTLAAKGFLMSSDWKNREDDFIHGEDLIIFKDVDDLRQKINFYLNHDNERRIIAQAGYEKVQKFSRIAWATRILELNEKQVNR